MLGLSSRCSRRSRASCGPTLRTRDPLRVSFASQRRGQGAGKACKVGRTVWTRTGQGLRNMACVMAYGKRLRLDYPPPRGLGLFIRGSWCACRDAPPYVRGTVSLRLRRGVGCPTGGIFTYLCTSLFFAFASLVIVVDARRSPSGRELESVSRVGIRKSRKPEYIVCPVCVRTRARQSGEWSGYWDLGISCGTWDQAERPGRGVTESETPPETSSAKSREPLLHTVCQWMYAPRKLES